MSTPSTSARSRHPKGVAVGGQFAAEHRPESGEVQLVQGTDAALERIKATSQLRAARSAQRQSVLDRGSRIRAILFQAGVDSPSLISQHVYGLTGPRDDQGRLSVEGARDRALAARTPSTEHAAKSHAAVVRIIQRQADRLAQAEARMSQDSMVLRLTAAEAQAQAECDRLSARPGH